MSECSIPPDVDVVVVGSGMAGLVTAILIDSRRRVLVITKKGSADSNTNFAQGGIAAAVGPEDSPEVHMADTLRAGSGLAHQDVVEGVAIEGPAAVRRLQEWGVGFSHGANGRWDLGREGGHTNRRIVHALDRTGEEIERSLLDCVKARSNISLIENVFVADVIIDKGRGGDRRALGLELIDESGEGLTKLCVSAKVTVLATGGAGQVYQFTSNPDIATGDGLAIGYRAGASVSNLEFVQFHPTTFYNPSGESFLITEALRGEGAKLIRPDGSRFMHKYDSREELASRDVVARAIDQEMKELHLECVYLDATALKKQFARARFPGINEKCLAVGLDFTVDPIPVVPAAHYMCGGLRTSQTGATEVGDLFACGEVAHTGLHGANRLASNSLLEAVVFATRVAETVNVVLENGAKRGEPFDEQENLRPAEDAVEERAQAIRHELRRLMWSNVGIVRSDRGLDEAVAAVSEFKMRVNQLHGKGESRILLETRNLVDVAQLIAGAASWRKESRGLHYNTDHPARGGPDWRKDSVMAPGER